MLNKQWNFSELSPSPRLAAGLTLLLAEFLGIIGNTFVLVIIVRILKHRKSIPNLLILILTLVDLITLPLTYTQAILAYLGGGYYFGGQIACDFHSTAITFCKYMAILVTCLISLDRFMALTYPFCYKNHLLYDETRKCRLVALLVPLTILIAILSALPLFGVSSNVLQYPGSYCLFDMQPAKQVSAGLIGIHISLLAIFLIIIVTANVGVCIQAHMLIQKIKPSLKVSKREAQLWMESRKQGRTIGKTKRLRPKQERKLLRTSAISTTVFLVCWLPFMVRMCLEVSGVPFSEGLGFASARLVSLQSVLDPWTLPITRKQYRSGFLLLSHKVIRVLSAGLVKSPANNLDEIIDARANRREALRYFAERIKAQMSKAEDGIATEQIELTNTCSQNKEASKAFKLKDVYVTVYEENANCDNSGQEETSQ